MSCGIMNEDNIRSITVKEDVPWRSLDEVQLSGMRHDGRLYPVIRYYPLGTALPPTFHSVWRTWAAARTYLSLNPDRIAQGERK